MSPGEDERAFHHVQGTIEALEQAQAAGHTADPDTNAGMQSAALRSVAERMRRGEDRQ